MSFDVTPRHCIHADHALVANDGTISGQLQYCCLCGQERWVRMKDVSFEHGPYLRSSLLFLDLSIWDDACPLGRLPQVKMMPA